GRGTRLRPLTTLRPKAMCPVDNVPLVDLAIERAASLTSTVAVNVHHGRDLLEPHLDGRVHVSIEAAEALGTAGALGQLREWIAARPVLVVTADAWYAPAVADLHWLADGWDGEHMRLAVVPAGEYRPDFGRSRYAGAALLPWRDVSQLRAEPSGL